MRESFWTRVLTPQTHKLPSWTQDFFRFLTPKVDFLTPQSQGRTAAKLTNWDPIWTRPDRVPTSKCTREYFWKRILTHQTHIWSSWTQGKNSIFDQKVDFLTPQSHRPYSSQINQLGPHLGPSRPVPDLKMHAGILLDGNTGTGEMVGDHGLLLCWPL